MRNTGRIVFVLAVVLGICAAAPGGERRQWKDGKWVTTPAPSKGTAGGELAMIRKYVEQGKGAKAVKAAKKFLLDRPDARECEEVLLLAGQAEFDRKRYYQAFEWFEKQLRNYPGGRFFDRALDREFRIAEKFLAGEKQIVWKVFRLSAREEGLEILSRIVEHAPGTRMAQKALMLTGNYHFRRAKYNEAIEAYDRFLELFGKTPAAAHAMLQAARATLASFSGVDHDETPLIEAEHRFRLYVERFPLRAEKTGAAADLERIAYLRAQKLFSTARFYQRIGRKKSAVFYYRRVIEQYPAGVWAAKAEKAIGKLGVTPVAGAKPRAASPATRPARLPPPDEKTGEKTGEKGGEKK